MTEVSINHEKTNVIDAVATDTDSNTFKITPNPACDVIYLSNSNITSLSIYSITGTLVKKTAVDAEGVVNVSDIAKGHYVVLATTANGKTLSSKLLKK